LVNRVFIIGAGASKAFGVPIGREYLKACLEFGVKSDYKNIQNLLEYLEKLIPGGKEQYEKLAFEELLSIMQKDRLLTNRLMGLSMPVDAEKILIGCLCKFLWDKSNNVLFENRIVSLEQIANEKWPYVDFINKLDNEEDCIITTNYDAMIDRAACVRWNSCRYSEYSKLTEKLDKPIALFKPLGSIAWIPGSFIQNSRFSATGRNAAVDYNIHGIIEKLTDSPEIYIYKDLPKYFDNGKNDYPVIIPPTIGADVPEAWGDFFLELNKQMLRRLSKADEIYIIGYSFPKYYEYFRILVRKALMLNRQEVKVRVINVDGKNLKELKQTIKSFITKKKVEYYSSGFESWKNLFVEGKKIPYVE